MARRARFAALRILAVRLIAERLTASAFWGSLLVTNRISSADWPLSSGGTISIEATFRFAVVRIVLCGFKTSDLWDM